MKGVPLILGQRKRECERGKYTGGIGTRPISGRKTGHPEVQLEQKVDKQQPKRGRCWLTSKKKGGSGNEKKGETQ